MITEEEAQEIHDLARFTDPMHDDVPCWCCCLDCDFDEDGEASPWGR